MIIGEALKVVFSGLKVNGIDVTTHYGDQKELSYWVASHKRNQTFPLIWYVVNKTTPISQTQVNVKTQLILFHLSNNQMLNSERFTKHYDIYLNPLLEKVNTALKSNKYIYLRESRFGLPYIDEPNFGIKKTELDFSSLNKTQEQKSPIIETVDAKILYLDMDINPNCII